MTALNALFLDKGRATVSENAGDEGTWETYRDHHLMPELKEMPGFVMTVAKEDVQTFGTTSIVRQIGSFTVPDPNHPDAPRKYLAAVTYVVVDEGGSPKIAHLALVEPGREEARRRWRCHARRGARYKRRPRAQVTTTTVPPRRRGAGRFASQGRRTVRRAEADSFRRWSHDVPHVPSFSSSSPSPPCSSRAAAPATSTP
jgi:hypothetical protein